MERRARILVVDDEPANRRLLSDLAVREGYEAVTAEGGEEALALLADGSIDLVLLILAAATLVGGGVCVAFGQPSLARFAWLLGTLPVLLAVTAASVE